MDEVTINSAQLLTSYGALGVCTLYFMAKDWIKSQKTDTVLGELRDAIKEQTAATLMCNRNGSIK